MVGVKYRGDRIGGTGDGGASCDFSVFSFFKQTWFIVISLILILDPFSTLKFLLLSLNYFFLNKKKQVGLGCTDCFVR